MVGLCIADILSAEKAEEVESRQDGHEPNVNLAEKALGGVLCSHL